MNKLLAILFLLTGTELFSEVQALTEDSQGNILVASDASLLQLNRDGKVQPLGQIQVNQRINALAVDKKGRLWIGTEQGILRCESGSCSPAPGAPSGPVRSIAFDQAQSLWIATDKELMKMDEAGAVSKPIRANRVEAVAVAKTGEVWIGSGHEVMQWNGTESEAFTLPPPPPNVRMRPPVTSILPARSGKLYVGTRMNLLLLSGKTFKQVSDAEVLALLEDAKGNIWIGTSDGLKRMSNGKMIDVSLH